MSDSLHCVYWRLDGAENRRCFNTTLEAYKFLHCQLLTGKDRDSVSDWSVRREAAQ